MTDRLLSRFARQRVLVLGDALLDEWVTGRPSRLCREGPVAVVDVDEHEYAAGGVANTAANIAALGARVVFASVSGDDAAGRRLRDRLTAVRGSGNSG